MTIRKWGTEQLVNTTTEGAQLDPTVTALKGGGFVVAWVDDGLADSVIRFQIFDEQGRRVGPERLGSFTLGDQTQPAVAALDTGGFWIVNRDRQSGDTEQDLSGKLFSADGTLVGFMGSTDLFVAENPSEVALGTRGFGGFGSAGNVMVWTERTSTNGDILMRAFRADGSSLFGPLVVNQGQTLGTQDQPAVAVRTFNSNNVTAVVWRDSESFLRARLVFDGGGVGSDIQVAQITSGMQSEPQVVWLSQRAFVVVWTQVGPDEGGTASIQARLFTSEGTPASSQFTVGRLNDFTSQTQPVVAATPEGGFVVAYRDLNSGPPENAFTGIRLHAYDAFGQEIGRSVVVNTTTRAFQDAPALATLADGRVVVTWTDSSNTGGDTSGFAAIRMQIIDPRDGIVTARNDALNAGLYGHDAVGDEIYGTPNADRLYGLRGEDQLYGGSGDDQLRGGRGDDVLTGGPENDLLDGDDGGRRFVSGQGAVFEPQGMDTAVFDLPFAQTDVRFLGYALSISTPFDGVDTVQRVELFQFADRTIARDAQDGVDDLFYYAVNPDVLASGLDADAHYWGVGRFEGRNPNSLFDRAYYLQNNPDVAAAGLEPFSHYIGNGWREGRNPSAAFNTNAYLQANPDVAASGENPLLHYLRIGADQGRLRQVGFDDAFYLASNPDVAAARIDPFLHYQLSGRAQNRDPSALFDADGYLATYGDVAAAGLDPLNHYLSAGWRENRDPSTGFDTSAYLTAWGDVAAAGINPLYHYLVSGQFEGRSPINDGVWG